MMANKIMLDPGHGGNETGAFSRGVKEKDLNYQVCHALKNKLESLGFEVAMTRYQDIDVSLESRVQQANLWQANIFISVHHNAFNGQASGYEIYHFTGSMQGSRLANAVGKQFDKTQRKRYIGGGMWAGSKKDEYYVIKNTHMPAILTEYCFIDNPLDFAKYNPCRQAEDIARGICEYFGVTYKEKEEPVEDIEFSEAQIYLERFGEPTAHKELVYRMKKILENTFTADAETEKELQKLAKDGLDSDTLELIRDISRKQLRHILRR